MSVAKAPRISGTYERFDGTRFSLDHTTLDEYAAKTRERFTTLGCSKEYVDAQVTFIETSKKVN